MIFTWDGEHMVPPARLQKICDQYYVIGQAYLLGEHQERSMKSHAHYFACVNEAWKNLPEHLVERFPTPDHLRRFCLIRAGFANHREMVADSAEEAQKIAAFLRPVDPYAVVTVKDCVVTIYTAKSQDMRSMDKAEFQSSKDSVLDQLARIIGVTTDQLQQHAKEAA
jgi:hypothetical protein